MFYSTLMEVLGGERIIGVDIFIPDDLKERLASHGKVSERLSLITGSSIEKTTLVQINNIVGDCRQTMVILGSYHTHDHVFKELELYSSLVGEGYYLICGDTVIEDIPEQKHRLRPWGIGNNPKTALSQFLQGSDRFEVDKKIQNGLLFTCNPNGYLKAIKD